MSRANDPFEEFLRKKKVEMLEEQYRTEGDAPDAPAPEEEPFEDGWAPDAKPPETEQEKEAQLEQEMSEFFEEGGTAGAELFERASEIDEERVEEIQDALDDVFEAEEPEPAVAEEVGETFVDFFKQVQDSFIEPGGAPAPAPEPEPEPEVDEGEPFEDEPLTADFPTPEEQAAAVEVEASPKPFPAVESRGDTPPEADDRLSLDQILLAPQQGDDLGQRIELLSRLVVKLVERSKLPESEIIEVLIKSGVEF